MKTVATRFAPSPTGPLHIGGVRTALFNWLYSKNKGGKFYLRIEDTDNERSKDEFKNQIINSLKWIGINYEDSEYIQSDKIDNHINVANELLKKIEKFYLKLFPNPINISPDSSLFPNVAEIPIVLSFGIRNLRYEIANSI